MSEPTWELLGGGGVLGPAGIDYIGDWAAGVTYQPGQIVRYNGVDYMAVNPSVGQIPPAPATPLPPGIVKILDVVVGRGQPGDPAAPAATIDTNTILGGNIPQIYRHLQLEMILHGDGAGSNQYVQIRFNNDSGANYYWQQADAAAAGWSVSESLAATSAAVATLPNASAVPASASYTTTKIGDYTGTVFHKAFHSSIAGGYGNATSQQEMRLISARWANAAAITRITLYPLTGNFVTGSRLTLYGLT